MAIPDIKLSEVNLPQVTGSFDSSIDLPTNLDIYQGLQTTSDKKDTIDDLINQIKSNSNYPNYQASIESKLDDITNNSQDILDKAGDLTGKSIKSLYSQLENLQTSIGSQTISKVVKNIQENIKITGETSSPTINSDWCDKFLNTINSLGSNLHLPIISKLDEVISQLEDALNALTNNLDPSSFIDDALSFCNDALNRITNKLKFLDNLLNTIVQKSKLSKLISAALSLPNQLLGGLFDKLSSCINLVDNIENKVAALMPNNSAILNKCKSIKNTISDLSDNNVLDDLGNLKNNFTNKLKLTNSLYSKVDNLKRDLNNISNLKSTVIPNHITQSLHNRISEINNIRSELLTHFNNSKTLTNDISVRLSSITEINKLMNHLNNNSNEVINKIDDSTNIINNNIPELTTDNIHLTTVLEDINTKLSNYTSQLENIKNNITDTLKLNLKPAQGFITQLTTKEITEDVNLQDKIDKVVQNVEDSINNLSGDCDSYNDLPNQPILI